MEESKSTLPLPLLVEKVKELSAWHTLQNPGLGVGFTEDEKRQWWKSKDYKYKLGTIRSVDLDTIITIYSETFDMSKKQKEKKQKRENPNSPTSVSAPGAPTPTKKEPYTLTETNIEKISSNTGINIRDFDEELIEGNLDTMKTVTQFEELYLGWIPSTDHSKESIIIKETMKTLFRFVFGKKTINDKNKMEKFYAHLRVAYTKFGPEEKVPCKGNAIADNFKSSLEYRLAGVKKEIDAARQIRLPNRGIFIHPLSILEKGLIQMINFLDSKSGCFEYGQSYSGEAKRSEESEEDEQQFLRALMVAKELVGPINNSQSHPTEESLKITFGKKAYGTAAELIEEINKLIINREPSIIEELKNKIKRLEGAGAKGAAAHPGGPELAQAMADLAAARAAAAAATKNAADALAARDAALAAAGTAAAGTAAGTARLAAAEAALLAANARAAEANARANAAEAALAEARRGPPGGAGEGGAGEGGAGVGAGEGEATEVELQRLRAELAAAQAQAQPNNTAQLKKTILVLMFSLIRSRRAFELLSAQMDDSEEIELERINRDVDEKIASLPEEAQPLVRGIFNFLTEKPVEGEPIEVLKDLIRRKGEAQKIIELANRVENPLRRAAVTSVEEGIQSIDALIKKLRKDLEDKVAELNARIRGLSESLALKDDSAVRAELARVKAQLTRVTADLDECNRIKGKQEVTISILQAKITALALPEDKRADIDARLAAFEAALTGAENGADSHRIEEEFAAETARRGAASIEEAAAASAAADQAKRAADAAAAREREASDAAATREREASDAALAAATARAEAAEKAAEASKKASIAKDAAVAASRRQADVASALAKSSDAEKEELAKQLEEAAAAAQAATDAAAASAREKTAADEKAATLEREKVAAEAAATSSAAAATAAEAARREAVERADQAENATIIAARGEAAAASAQRDAAVAEKEAAEAALAALTVEKDASSKDKADAETALREATERAAASEKAARDSEASVGKKIAEATAAAEIEVAKAKKEAKLARELFEAASGQIARGQAAIGAVEAAQAESERLKRELAKMTARSLGSSPDERQKHIKELAAKDAELAEANTRIAAAQRAAADAATFLTRATSAEQALAIAKSQAAAADARLLEITSLTAASQALHEVAIERHAAISAENKKLIDIVVRFIGQIKGGPVQPTIESIERELSEFPVDAAKRVEAALALIKGIRDGTDRQSHPIERIEGVLRNTNADTSAPEIGSDRVAAREAAAREAARQAAEAAREAAAREAARQAAEAAREAAAAREAKAEATRQAAAREAEAARQAAEAAREVETSDEARVRREVDRLEALREIERIKDEIYKYAFIGDIKDNKELSSKYKALARLESPTQADLDSFLTMLDTYINSPSNEIKKTAIYFINVFTSDEYGRMLSQTKGPIQVKTRVPAGSPIDIIADSIRSKEIGKPENISKIIDYLKNNNEIFEKINEKIASYTVPKTKIFLLEIKKQLDPLIRKLISELADNLYNHSSRIMYRAKAQSGGFRKSSKASHLCDLMLTSILLKLDGSEFNYQALIDKAGKTLDDIGQCDLILEMLNHLIDEHCLINKTDGYNFSSVYMNVSEAKALVEAFNENFTDKEKQKFYEISGGVFNYKVPDEHQTLLGKHPFFLVGTPSEETPLYGVIDQEITLTMEERSVLEEGSIPIGAILFLYIVCFRENEGNDPGDCVPRPNRGPQ